MKKLKNNKSFDVSLQPRRVVARWSAFLLVICGVLGYSLSASAYNDPHSVSYASIDYVKQNWGLFFIIAELVFAYVLKRMQGGLYWFSWLQLQKTNPDERQSAVRKRVFERSYAIALFVIFVFGPAVVIHLAKFANPAQDDLLRRLSWVCAIFFVSLPSILAGWQKDS